MKARLKVQWIFLMIVFSTPSSLLHAQTSQGAEIVTYNTFGEGLMVTKAKMAPISGTVSNIFFYNRADEPWNGNVWYEYDWELRGGYPTGGWSQIRVREDNGGRLRDAPIDVVMTENIGQKFLHYILLRQGSRYVYDVRENFDVNTYDYTKKLAHGNNSASIINGGARVYFTGGSVADIPTSQRLDFSLGITSFNNSFSGPLPNSAYSGDYIIDFTRFYAFNGNKLSVTPQWQDEFNGNSLDFSKWFPATWTFADTQFTPDNILFDNGHIILRVDRDQTSNTIRSSNLTRTGQASQSTTVNGGHANFGIDGSFSNNLATLTANESNAWWEVELAHTSDIDQIVIHHRTDCCNGNLSNFSVSVLDENDNVVWTQFYGNSPGFNLTINMKAVGKKVRINRNGILSLVEVEVFGTGPDIIDNLALAGTASQSSTDYGGNPARAIDNNTSGTWRDSSVTHTSNLTNSWWQVELQQETQINQIVLFNRTDKCCSARLSDFTVSVLDHRGHVVWSQFYAEPPVPSLSIHLSAVGNVVQVSRNGTLSLAEVQVF